MSDLYFGKSVDDAIVLFCANTDPVERSKIFEKDIYPAFKKLCTYHYNKFPIVKNPEVIHECIAFLFEQLHRFNPEKQSRGFPYFNIIAKHYYIQKLKKESRIRMNHDFGTISLNEVAGHMAIQDGPEPEMEATEFYDILRTQLPLWRDKFVKEQEKQVVDCLITLFDEPGEIEILKKKALLLYIKEMTGLNTKQVTINLNKVKEKFLRLKSKYQRGEI